MNVTLSGLSPNSIASDTSRSAAQAPDIDKKPAANPVLAATVEISSSARQAYAESLKSTGGQGIDPLNIIWGNGPR